METMVIIFGFYRGFYRANERPSKARVGTPAYAHSNTVTEQVGPKS